MSKLINLSAWGTMPVKSCPLHKTRGQANTDTEDERKTLILFEASKPSSWFKSSSIVRWTSLSPLPLPDSIRADPMLSISSMKMMDGACSLYETKRIIRTQSCIYSTVKCNWEVWMVCMNWKTSGSFQWVPTTNEISVSQVADSITNLSKKDSICQFRPTWP